MATIINASNSTGLTLTSDLSGVLQFQNNGVNLPMGGVAPAFFAYQNGSSAITSGAATKIPFNTELFDTNNNFDSTTNYRFTPTVAGYYQINVTLRATGSSITNGEILIYKNGSAYLHSYVPWTSSQAIGSICSIVYCNGSTDYIEAYCYVTGSSLNFSGGGQPYVSSMSGSLVRGA